MQSKHFFLAVALLPLALTAQETSKPHIIRATGEATVTAKPDRAQVSIGVVNQSPTAQAAAATNADQTSQVIDAIKKALGSGGDLKTSGYSISPQYQYAQGRPPKVTGYEASNTVLVTVNELTVLGKVIDAATASSANNIHGITFSVRDDSALRNQALAEAAAKAKAAAEAMAKALDVHVLGVLQAETMESSPVRPMTRMYAAATESMAKATPIEAGDLEIHATVTVTLEIR